MEFPPWYRGLGIYHCCSCGIGRSSSSHLIRGLGTSICQAGGQQERKKEKERKERRKERENKQKYGKKGETLVLEPRMLPPAGSTRRRFHWGLQKPRTQFVWPPQLPVRVFSSLEEEGMNVSHLALSYLLLG